MNQAFARVFGDLSHQNQVLKSIVAALATLLLIALCAVLLFSYRGPTVVGLSESGDVIELSDVLTKRQVEAAVRHYLRLRYTWRKDSLTAQSQVTESMITPGAVLAFRKTIQDLVKFSAGKNVEQRVYARTVEVDMEKRTALVVADRINDIESLKAATELRVALKYSLGDRTASNPWGVYIEKEAEGEAR